MVKISMRWVLVILGCYGMMINYAIRSNLSILLVSMLNHTELKRLELELLKQQNKTVKIPPCGVPEEKQEREDGLFVWDSRKQGFLVSAYYGGYILMQVPGGRMSDIISAKWVFFGAVLVNIITTMLTPISAYLDYHVLLVIRLIQGLGGAPFFPAMHALMAQWAPPKEKQTMTTIIYAGTALGTLFSVAGSGLIAKHFSWEAAFYTVGVISSLWLGFWIILVSDTPQTNKFISEEEKQYIVEAVGRKDKKKPKFPCLAILKSAPFWAICVAHTCSTWGFYLLLTQTPFYFKFLGLSLTHNTLSSSVPYFLQWVCSVALGYVMDLLFRANKIRLITIRKISSAIALIGPSICFLTLCYVGCNIEVAITAMCLAIIMVGAMFSGYFVNHGDISPNFAGSLMGISNVSGTLPGIIVPIFVGFITELDPTVVAWRVIFYITIGLYMLGLVVYTLFASATVQDWNNIQEEPVQT